MFVLAEPPLTPDEDTARDWVQRYLDDPEIVSAKPSPFERFMESVWEWVSDLFTLPDGSGFGINPVALVWIVAIIALVALVVLLGRPRAVAKRAARAGQSVFLDDDARTLHQLRDAADHAAASGNYSLAIVEQYRAMCRGLHDRTLITLRPGDTAQAAARAAATSFPSHQQQLQRAAMSFDRVRYLNRRGTAAEHAFIRNLDHELDRTRPASLPDASGFAATPAAVSSTPPGGAR
ncbi:DUF4129 domain-containing protein [Gulosibacter bifidus]|uniref:DUF4129 domain-containing protein n=1 Tax=Gulosibacter bifidus TaxID=272239 RepID=A0ABW5RKA8_9MICO|nr:DUF4129 domain-containing protein [Gulosibacter bifidus]